MWIYEVFVYVDSGGVCVEGWVHAKVQVTLEHILNQDYPIA